MNASLPCVIQLSVASNHENSVRAEVSVRLTCKAETRVTSPGKETVIISIGKTFFSVLCVLERNIIPILPIATDLQSDASNSDKYFVD